MKRIYIDEWMNFKPYKNSGKVDMYYLNLCNEVKARILSGSFAKWAEARTGFKDMNMLSCFLVSYFEDLISGTNLWNTFVKKNKELYGKPLPFFPCHTYYEEEINQEDVCFLIWYCLNCQNDRELLIALDRDIWDVAVEIMKVFEDEWETAPENERLKSSYDIDANEADYFVAREFLDKLFFRSYLFIPDLSYRLAEEEIEILEKDIDAQETRATLINLRDHALHNYASRLLAFRAVDWACELLEENAPIRAAFENMSRRVQGNFLLKDASKKHIYLEHIATGKFIPMSKKSIDRTSYTEEKNTIIHCGMVRWRDEWWLSGVFAQGPYNVDFVNSDKQSVKSISEFNFLDNNLIKSVHLLRAQEEAFLAFNDGSPIAFMSTNEMKVFTKRFAHFYREKAKNKLSFFKRMLFKIRERNFSEIDGDLDVSGYENKGLVFFNPKSGIELAMGVNSAFPLPSNPFLKEEDSAGEFMFLLIDDSISTELVMYCVEHCKDNITFLKEKNGQYLLENIDFVLRFFKKQRYHTTPEVSFKS